MQEGALWEPGEEGTWMRPTGWCKTARVRVCACAGIHERVQHMCVLLSSWLYCVCTDGHGCIPVPTCVHYIYDVCAPVWVWVCSWSVWLGLGWGLGVLG